ncbi:heterogeneous nuclear ribonucleoprotein F-like isoform X1 [Trichogramma pretiosum]|uniref:heterogeneous nuclear ribonucleoprotein F-like isoform X1 n=1 Tax=Trichogramma pretiosum TaxID=7493 RepID=UPI0006C9D190|nr:heterogeneous nuclear ribonucleoprotein F-like isoform X1 [Trichogramma pretiosum]XP_023318640.1 heterogeneous nuclear ribonucleoprotein F-like isoform X1 [Trichogramma pretiosum]XP_023318641.1 heterogeneous nuclear ribonucleoprotein F-like isoform X1 [Trichogramma pretiosum]
MVNGNDNESNSEEGHVVKIRGLPWSTTVDEVIAFFGDCRILNGKNGVHMTMSREGRPSGEAFIEMESEADIEAACKKDRDHMGHRYIEVFKAKRGEMEYVIKRSGYNLENAMDDGCVRLRGLPFGCSKEEIAQFFSGLEIVPNGITLPTDYTGRSTGEAYVQFINKDVAERALQKHKEKIGHRYIEIFRSNLSEVHASIGPKMRGGPMGGFNQRPAPYDRGNRFGAMNRFGNNLRNNRAGPRDYDNNSWGNGNNFPPRGNMGGGMRGGMGMMEMKGSGDFRGNDNWNSNPGRHSVHMRGLPFKASEQDIADFFRPLIPVNIRMILENGGRASGEADVDFATHEEAVRAMTKDKSHMSHRYIELFLNSSGPSPNQHSNNQQGGSSQMLGGIGNFCGGLRAFQSEKFLQKMKNKQIPQNYFPGMVNNFRTGFSGNNRGYGNNQMGGNNFNNNF